MHFFLNSQWLWLIFILYSKTLWFDSYLKNLKNLNNIETITEKSEILYCLEKNLKILKNLTKKILKIWKILEKLLKDLMFFNVLEKDLKTTEKSWKAEYFLKSGIFLIFSGIWIFDSLGLFILFVCLVYLAHFTVCVW